MADVVGLSVAPHNDLHFNETGNLVLVYDGEAIGQHARQRLKAWQGEWFLNLDAGVDWLFYVFDRPPSEKPIADAEIKRVIRETPGVTEIQEYSSSYERQNRGVFVDRCAVLTSYGELFI